jgi:HPt (histidine-containing phosphotransfer) domain-containing protein
MTSENPLDPFESIRRRFLDRTMAEIPVLRALAAGTPPVDASRLSDAVHTMAGTGGTLGFRTLADAAGRLEALLRDGREGPQLADAAVALADAIDAAVISWR